MIPPLQGGGQNYANPPNIVGPAIATKSTGGDRALAVLCYLSPPLLIAYGAGFILILICYFAGRKRPFVRFHFMQSLVFFILSFIALFGGEAIAASNHSDSAASGIGYTILGGYVTLTLLCIILSGAGKRVHIPIAGLFASIYAKRQPKGTKKTY
jgi:uncharacterized membrane protein